MMLLTAPASSWQVRSASPRYSVSGERAGLHFWITASLPNLLAMWKVVALWGTVSKREPLKWLDVEGNCTCFISLFSSFSGDDFSTFYYCDVRTKMHVSHVPSIV